MGRRKCRGNRKKKLNVKLEENQSLPVQEIYLDPECTGKSIDTKLDETTSAVESRSETELPVSQRRSNRSRAPHTVSYQCKICHLEFSAEYNLRQHLDSYGDPKFPCKQCNTKFTSKRHLETHVVSAHGVPKRKFPLKCSVCNQLFMVPGHLQAHLGHYHEDWKEPDKTIELKTVTTEIPDLITNSEIPVKTKRRRTKIGRRKPTEAQLQAWKKNRKQRLARLVANHETEQSIQPNTLFTENVDTSIVSTETVDLNAICTQTVDPSTVCTETLDTNTVSTENLDTNTVSTENVDTNIVSTENVDTNTVSTETVDTNIVSTENVDTNTVSTETVDTNTFFTETVDADTFPTETVDINTSSTKTADINTSSTKTADINTSSTKAVETNVTPTETVVTEELSNKIVQIVTSTTVPRSPLEVIESDKNLTEAMKAVLTNALNSDVLEIRVKTKYRKEDTTMPVSHVEMDEINHKDVQSACTDEENQQASENILANGEGVIETQQVLSINGSISEILESTLENTTDTITKKDDQVEGVYPIQIQHDENKTDEKTQETENITLESHERKTQALEDTSIEHCTPIEEVIKPLIELCSSAPNEADVFQLKEKNVIITTMTPSQKCEVPNKNNKYRITKNRAKSMTLRATRCGKNSMVVPFSNIEEKAPNDNGEKSREIRNYDKELELRRLYSCMDCYVPLVRVQSSQSVCEIGKATNQLSISHGEQLPAVIPSLVCNRIFASKDIMLRHYRLHHFKFFDNKIHCVCGQEMNGKRALDFHFYRYCQKPAPATTFPSETNGPCKPLEKNHGCTGCGEKFWLESCLRSHVYSCSAYLKRKVQKILNERENRLASSHKHRCRVCHAAFSSEERLLKHNETYSSVATHQCVFCGTKFPGDDMLRIHMESAHALDPQPGNPYVCNVCNQGFPNKRFERIHRMHFHREQAYNREPETNNLSPPDSDDPGNEEKSVNKCRVCNLEFFNKKRFIDHTIYYTKSEIIYCKTCGGMFEGQYRAHHHNKTVHYTQDTRAAFTHHCDICMEGFMYKDHLQAHMLHVHIGETTITTHADQNNKNQFQSQNSDGQRVCQDQDVAVPSREHVCPVCDVEFPTQVLLSAHESEFANEGEYFCNRCSKKCRTPSLLLDHLTLNHSNNAMQGGVKCRRCSENFLTQRAWICHVKHFHNTEEPSEFYLEKNIASTEAIQDIRYELIPTNESISSGVTYSKVKSSMNTCTPGVEIDDKNRADEGRISPEETSTKFVTVGEEKVITDSIVKNNVNLEEHSAEFKIREDVDNDVLIIDEYTQIAIDVPITDKEKSTSSNKKLVVTTKSSDNASSVELNDAEKTEPRNGLTKTYLPNDRRRGTSDEAWHCSICGFLFRSKAYLGKHVSMYTDSGEHMCEICGRRFNVGEFYRQHKLRHVISEKVCYYCSSCSEGFRTYQSMKMHVAHFHRAGRKPMTAGVENKSVQNPQKKRKTPSQAQDKPSLSLHASSHSAVVDTPAKKTVLPLPSVPTHLPHHSDIPTKVKAKGNPLPKPTTVSKSSRLQTVFVDDDISVIYKCISCKEGFSTAEKLNEHLKTAHTFTRDVSTTVKSSVSADTQLPSDAFQHFANANVLSAHKKQLNLVQSSTLQGSFDAVIDITASSSTKIPDVDQRSIVIGRLYKLRKIDSLPMSANSATTNVPKAGEKTAPGLKIQQHKPLVSPIISNKGSYAVPRRLSLVKTTLEKVQAVASLKRLPASTEQKKTNLDVRLSLPIGNIDEQGKKQVDDRLTLPARHAVQDKTSTAVQQLNLRISNAVRKTMTATARQLNHSTVTLIQKQPNSGKEPTSSITRVIPLTIDSRLKSSVLKTTHIRSQNVPKQSQRLSADGAQLIPLAVDSPLKTSTAKNAQSIPQSVHKQFQVSVVKDAVSRAQNSSKYLHPLVVKDAVSIPLSVYEQSKPLAVDDAQLTPLTVDSPFKSSIAKNAQSIPQSVPKQLQASVVKDAVSRAQNSSKYLHPLVVKDAVSIPLSVYEQSKPLAVDDAQLTPLIVDSPFKSSTAKNAQSIPQSVPKQLQASVVKDAVSRSQRLTEYLKPFVITDAVSIPLSVYERSKPLAVDDAQLIPLTVDSQFKSLAAKNPQFKPQSVHKQLQPLAVQDATPKFQSSNEYLKPLVVTDAVSIQHSVNNKLKPLVVKDAVLIPQSVNKQLKPLAVKDSVSIPQSVNKQLKSLVVKHPVSILQSVDKQLDRLVVKDPVSIPQSADKQLNALVGKDLVTMPLTVYRKLKSSIMKNAQLIPLSYGRKVKLLPMKHAQSKSLTGHQQLEPLAEKNIPLISSEQLKPLTVEDEQLKLLATKDCAGDLTARTENDLKLQPPVHNQPEKEIDSEQVLKNGTQLEPQTVNDPQLKLRRLNMGMDCYLPLQTKDPSLTESDQQLLEGSSKILQITSPPPQNRSVLKRQILNNVSSQPIVSTPVVEEMQIKIVKVESYSKIASTVSAEIHCQFACEDCHTIFMTRDQLTNHEKCTHQTTSSDDQFVDEPSIAPTSPKSSINQLQELVGTLPRNPENEVGPEAEEDPFTITFESIMMPASTDEFLPEDEVSDFVKSESQSDPLVKSMTTNLRHYTSPLNIQPSASVDQNIQTTSNRKRKDNGTTNLHVNKRSKGIFDPIAYQELCRQHNLTPSATPDKRKLTQNTSESKTVGGI